MAAVAAAKTPATEPPTIMPTLTTEPLPVGVDRGAGKIIVTAPSRPVTATVTFETLPESDAPRILSMAAAGAIAAANLASPAVLAMEVTSAAASAVARVERFATTSTPSPESLGTASAGNKKLKTAMSALPAVDCARPR